MLLLRAFPRVSYEVYRPGICYYYEFVVLLVRTRDAFSLALPASFALRRRLACANAPPPGCSLTHSIARCFAPPCQRRACLVLLAYLMGSNQRVLMLSLMTVANLGVFCLHLLAKYARLDRALLA